MLATLVPIVGLVAWHLTGTIQSRPTEAASSSLLVFAPTDKPKLSVAQSVEGQRMIAPHFTLCGEVRITCVVDGDTFWLEGVKVRIADIDTPEVSQPECASEKALGDRATRRLLELLNQGEFSLMTIGERTEDRYGRKLRVVVRDGRSLGGQLVAEGLARTWTGQREPWC